MQDDYYTPNKEELKNLLQQYHALKKGTNTRYLEEESFEHIIDYYEDENNLQAAIEAVDIAIEQFPYSAMLIVKKANLFIACGLFEDALNTLDKAKILDATDMDVYILQIEAHLSLNQTDNAFKIFEQSFLLFAGGELIDFLQEMATVFADFDLDEKVFQCYKTLLLLQPKNKESLYKISFWVNRPAQAEESVELHNSILEQDPFNHLAWINLGMAYRVLKLYELAIEAFLNALALNDTVFIVHIFLAQSYKSLKKYTEALQSLQTLLKGSLPSADLYEDMADCYHKLKQFEQSNIYYDKALELAINHRRIEKKIKNLMAAQEWDWAIHFLLNRVHTTTHSLRPKYYHLLAQCLSKKQAHGQAIQYSRLAVQLSPQHPTYRKLLISTAIDAKQMKEALDYSLEAYKASNKPIFSLYISACLFFLNKNKDAILFLQDALHHAPKLIPTFKKIYPNFALHNEIVQLLISYHPPKAAIK